MRSPHDRSQPDCLRARETIHRLLDGEATDPRENGHLEAHRRACRACRELDSDLRALQHGLRGLGNDVLPQAALDDVWRRTVRAPASRPAWLAPRWRLAAAAVVALGIVGLWLVAPDRTTSPSDRELTRAAAETRAVMGLVARALNTTRRVAVRDVLAAEVSDPLRRAPIRWPEASTAAGESQP